MDTEPISPGKGQTAEFLDKLYEEFAETMLKSGDSLMEAQIAAGNLDKNSWATGNADEALTKAGNNKYYSVPYNATLSRIFTFYFTMANEHYGNMFDLIAKVMDKFVYPKLRSDEDKKIFLKQLKYFIADLRTFWWDRNISPSTELRLQNLSTLEDYDNENDAWIWTIWQIYNIIPWIVYLVLENVKQFKDLKLRDHLFDADMQANYAGLLLSWRNKQGVFWSTKLKRPLDYDEISEIKDFFKEEPRALSLKRKFEDLGLPEDKEMRIQMVRDLQQQIDPSGVRSVYPNVPEGGLGGRAEFADQGEEIEANRDDDNIVPRLMNQVTIGSGYSNLVQSAISLLFENDDLTFPFRPFRISTPREIDFFDLENSFQSLILNSYFVFRNNLDESTRKLIMKNRFINERSLELLGYSKRAIMDKMKQYNNLLDSNAYTRTLDTHNDIYNRLLRMDDVMFDNVLTLIWKVFPQSLKSKIDRAMKKFMDGKLVILNTNPGQAMRGLIERERAIIHDLFTYMLEMEKLIMQNVFAPNTDYRLWLRSPWRWIRIVPDKEVTRWLPYAAQAEDVNHWQTLLTFPYMFGRFKPEAAREEDLQYTDLDIIFTGLIDNLIHSTKLDDFKFTKVKNLRVSALIRRDRLGDRRHRLMNVMRYVNEGYFRVDIDINSPTTLSRWQEILEREGLTGMSEIVEEILELIKWRIESIWTINTFKYDEDGEDLEFDDFQKKIWIKNLSYICTYGEEGPTLLNYFYGERGTDIDRYWAPIHARNTVFPRIKGCMVGRAVLDRCCLYEAYFQAYYHADYIHGGKYDKMKTANLYAEIVSEFLAESSEFQNICVCGDIYRYRKYLEDIKYCYFNYWFFELYDENLNHFHATNEFTLFIKGTHCTLLNTKGFIEIYIRGCNIVKGYAKTQVYIDDTSGRYELKGLKEEWVKDNHAYHWCFDIESCQDINEAGLQKPYCVVCYNIENDNYQIFWGLDCSQQFCEWLNGLVDQSTFSNNAVARKTRDTPLQEKNLLISQRKHYFIGFNSGKFDLLLLLRDIIISEKSFECIGSASTIRKLNVGKNISFLDYLAIRPGGSLDKQYADIVKGSLKKGEVDHSLIFTNNYEDFKDEVLPYCKNDCLMLAELWKSYFKIMENVKQSPYVTSVAALALQSFRRWMGINKKPKLNGCSYEDYVNIIKPSYAGGICRLWHGKMKPNPTNQEIHEHNWMPSAVGLSEDYWTYIDANSLYCYALTQPLSYEIEGRTHDFQFTWNNKSHFNKINPELHICPYYLYFLTDFEYESDFLYPFIPFKSKEATNFKTLYPRDNHSGDFLPKFVWGRKLLLGFKHRAFKEINIQGRIQFKFGEVTTDWAKEVYSMRLKATSASEKKYYKDVANNLYGKTGQRPFKQTVFADVDDLRYLSQTVPAEFMNIEVVCDDIFLVTFENHRWETQIGGLSAIASSTTDIASHWLVETVLLASNSGREKNCIYSDTDSIILRTSALERIKDRLSQTELGKFKIEYHNIDNVYLLAPKMYMFDGAEYGKNDEVHTIIKAKGIRNPSKEWMINLSKELTANIEVHNVFRRKIDKVIVSNVKKNINI